MTKPKKKRAGRPSLPPESKLGYRLNAYLTNAQGDWVEEESKRVARTASEVVRGIIESEMARRVTR